MGEQIDIVGMRSEIDQRVVTGVEMFRKTLDEGVAGDNVGCLLRGVERDDVERGMVLARTGSITPHTEFNAQVYDNVEMTVRLHQPIALEDGVNFAIREGGVTVGAGVVTSILK